MEITEKVAYLKGLAEGMELDTDKKVGKLLAGPDGAPVRAPFTGEG